jgi:hypothetical protein
VQDWVKRKSFAAEKELFFFVFDFLGARKNCFSTFRGGKKSENHKKIIARCKHPMQRRHSAA